MTQGPALFACIFIGEICIHDHIYHVGAVQNKNGRQRIREKHVRKLLSSYRGGCVHLHIHIHTHTYTCTNGGVNRTGGERTTIHYWETNSSWAELRVLNFLTQQKPELVLILNEIYGTSRSGEIRRDLHVTSARQLRRPTFPC